VFQNQQKLTHDDLVSYARQLGLDVGRFEKAITQGNAKPLIDADAAEAKALGATGTPAFFINGRFLSGAKPFNEFAEMINAELTRLKVPVPPAAAVPAAPAAGQGGR